MGKANSGLPLFVFCRFIPNEKPSYTGLHVWRFLEMPTAPASARARADRRRGKVREPCWQVLPPPGRASFAAKAGPFFLREKTAERPQHQEANLIGPTYFWIFCTEL